MEVKVTYKGDYTPGIAKRKYCAFVFAIISIFIVPRFVESSCTENIVGEIKKYKELSGLAASHKHQVLYSIEDSQNKESVYAFHENGTLLGEIILENVKQNDFEDIALAPGPERNLDYIYVADIGNNWSGHCKGINEPNKRIHMFKEPNIDLYSTGQKVTIPESQITTIELNDPTLTTSSSCIAKNQIDTEAMFIDPISNSGYLIQKVHTNPKCCNDFSDVGIFQFDLPETPNGKTHIARLNRVGSLPITKRSLMPTDFNKNDERNNVPWPLVITAGDISRDGTKIILRSYNVIRIWNRNTSAKQTVEMALTQNTGTELKFCPEYQGEAITFKNDNTGFYTTTELNQRNASHEAAPIYYYPFPAKLSKASFKELGVLQLFICVLVSFCT